MSGSGGGSGGGTPKWTTIFRFSSAPPTAVVHLQSSKPFSWRIYGAMIPFQISGGPVTNTEQSVGWTLAYCQVDVLGPAVVTCQLDAFPGQ